MQHNTDDTQHMEPGKKDTISLRSFITGAIQYFKWRQYKTLIIALIFLGGLLGVVFAFLKHPKYEGKTSFIVEGTSKSGLDGYSNIAAQFGLNIGLGGSVFQQTDNIIAIIKSRNMVTKALLSSDPSAKSQLLGDRYLKFTGRYKDWKDDKLLGDFRLNAQHNSILQDSVLNLMYKEILKTALDVEKPDKKVDIIIVKTITRDELFSKHFTEALIDEVMQFYTSVQTKKASENLNVLKRQTDSVRTLLNSALAGVAVSIDANPNLNPAFQRARVGSQRKMVDVEMNKQILIELVKNLELAEISLRKETPLLQIIDTPVLPLEKHKTSKLLAGIVGMILGFLFATGIIYFKEYY